MSFQLLFHRCKDHQFVDKMGFVPNMVEATKDPKVRMELGMGGTPVEAENCMTALLGEYIAHSASLTQLGVFGGMLDRTPSVVKEYMIPEGDKAKIQHIVDNKLINMAGGMYKTGLIVANARVVLEGANKMIAAEAAAKMATAANKTNELIKCDCKTVVSHRAWMAERRLVDTEGYPK